MRQVYSNAGLDPSLCGFVEAHGTGTRVGDPIEATAIHNVLGQDRTPRDPLWIGSVKSNIGHLEGASGMSLSPIYPQAFAALFKTNVFCLVLRYCRCHQSSPHA